MSQQLRCTYCRAKNAQRVCGVCAAAPYCSEICADADWFTHIKVEPHCDEGEAVANEVWPHLWLGGVEALHDLQNLGVTAVLTVIQQDSKRTSPEWVQGLVNKSAAGKGSQKVVTKRDHLWLPHYDDPEDDLRADFFKATDWINKHLQNGQIVLVHCHAGISRSATTVAAYLLRYHADRFPNVRVVLEWLRCKRAVVNPNSGFVEQLKGWVSEDLQQLNRP